MFAFFKSRGGFFFCRMAVIEDSGFHVVCCGAVISGAASGEDKGSTGNEEGMFRFHGYS